MSKYYIQLNVEGEYTMEDSKNLRSDLRNDKERDTTNNIVSAEADISDINKARREKPSGDFVDERLPKNNQGHQWKQKDAEYMQQDEILNADRAASDNPGKDGRTLSGELEDNSKQSPTVPDNFYETEESKDRNKRGGIELKFTFGCNGGMC